MKTDSWNICGLTVRTSLILLMFAVLPSLAQAFAPPHPLTLWYARSARQTGSANSWMVYSLPIGNGQLGASIFGEVKREEIQFNEKTLWRGTPGDYSADYGKYMNFGPIAQFAGWNMPQTPINTGVSSN